MPTFLDGLMVVASSSHDFSVRQVALLFLCDRVESAADRQVLRLAKDLELSRPVLSRAASRLEEAGYIERSKLANDDRTCVLTVTRAGKRFIAQILGQPTPAEPAKPKRRRADTLAPA